MSQLCLGQTAEQRETSIRRCLRRQRWQGGTRTACGVLDMDLTFWSGSGESLVVIIADDVFAVLLLIAFSSAGFGPGRRIFTGA